MILEFALAFAAGYIIRHLLGIAFKRMFKKRMPDLFGGAEFLITKGEVKEIVVSFDGGRTWFLRTSTGWSKVNHDFVKKAMDKNVTDNPIANHAPGHSTVS